MMLDDNIFHWSMQEREHPNMGMSGRMSVEKKGIVCICITKYVHTVCPSQNLRLVQSPSHGGSLDPPAPGRLRPHKNHNGLLLPPASSFCPFHPSGQTSLCSQSRMMPLSNSMKTRWY